MAEEKKYKIVVFVSGGGTNLQTIINKIKEGYLAEVEIILVVASNPHCFALTRAKQHHIPSVIVSKKDYKSGKAYDQALLELLQQYDVDLIVLAGFLSQLGPKVVQAYRQRIINIHPALMPAFSGEGMYGIYPHQAALDYGVKITGATVHFVDEKYDHGAIILQKAIEIEDGDTAENLQQKVMSQCEQIILPQAIKLLVADEIALQERRTLRKKKVDRREA